MQCKDSHIHTRSFTVANPASKREYIWTHAKILTELFGQWDLDVSEKLLDELRSVSKTPRSTHTSRQEAYGHITRQVELQLRPARSHGCDHSGCDRDEQDVEIHLTSHDGGEWLQLESLDCNGGVELEDAMAAATCTSVPSKIMCPFSFSCIRKCFARDSRCYN